MLPQIFFTFFWESQLTGPISQHHLPSKIISAADYGGGLREITDLVHLQKMFESLTLTLPYKKRYMGMSEIFEQ